MDTNGLAMKVLLVAVGGGMGALCRWGLSSGVQRAAERWAAVQAPVGTFAANGVGCLLIGVAIVWLGRRANLRDELMLLFVTGFLGAFTTFSSYAFEVVQHGRGGAWVSAALHVLGHNLVGVAMVVVGMWLAERSLGGEAMPDAEPTQLPNPPATVDATAGRDGDRAGPVD